jgi:hypothetical protein
MKKVCINFVGQPKYLYNLSDIFENYIYSPDYEYHILYTTWKDVNVDEVKQTCPNIFIKHIDKPDTPDHPYYNEYLHIINNFNYDGSNLFMGKKINNFFLAQFIRDQSRYTIEEYEKTNSIIFDIIVTTRLDVDIQHQNISNYFNQILETKENTLFVGNAPMYDLYNQGSYPDALLMSNKNTMLQLLDYITILKFCAMDNNIFHPETASYKIATSKNINVVYLPFYAFIFDYEYIT